MASVSAEKAASNPRDFTKYADKPPSDLQDRMAKWILDVTGYEPDDLDSFNEGVRLAVALRMAFQASPENQAVLEKRREEAAAKKTAPPKKRGPKAKVSNPKGDDAEEETEEESDSEAAESEEAAETTVKRKPGKRAKPKVEAEPDDAAEEDGEEVPF